MTNPDDIYGKFGEDSKNPFGGLPDPGYQWPKGRGFSRAMSSPYAMARLAEVLCGFSAHLKEGGLRRNLSEDQRAKALAHIAGVLSTVVDLYPEILSTEPVALNNWDLPPYIADDRLAPTIERAKEWGES